MNRRKAKGGKSKGKMGPSTQATGKGSKTEPSRKKPASAFSGLSSDWEKWYEQITERHLKNRSPHKTNDAAQYQIGMEASRSETT